MPTIHADVICCGPEDDISQIVLALKKGEHIRRISLCKDHGDVRALMSIGGIKHPYAVAQQVQVHYLNECIYGRL